MGINMNEVSNKKINPIKSMNINFPSLSVKNSNVENQTLTLGNINDSPSNKVTNMKVLTFEPNYNFKNINNSDEENFEEEEKLFKGKKDKDKKGNLLIGHNKALSNNFNFPNEGKIVKKKSKQVNNNNNLKNFMNNDSENNNENEKNKIDSGRDKIIKMLNSMDVKSRGKFKFADFEGFVNKFL